MYTLDVIFLLKVELIPLCLEQCPQEGHEMRAHTFEIMSV